MNLKILLKKYLAKKKAFHFFLFSISSAFAFTIHNFLRLYFHSLCIFELEANKKKKNDEKKFEIYIITIKSRAFFCSAISEMLLF